MVQRTIVLVLQESGQMQIITGGEMAPVEGVIACRAAADWFQEQGVQAEVRRRVEEMRRDHGNLPPGPFPEREGGGSVDPSETPVVNG